MTEFFRLWLEAGKAGNRDGLSMESLSNHRDARRVLAETREATRGRPGPPKCPPRAARQGEVLTSLVLFLRGGSGEP